MKTIVVLVISFQPYSRHTVETLDFIHERGARIVAVTDTTISPLTERAEIVLCAKTLGPQFFPSQVVVVCILEYLISFIISNGREEALAQIDAIGRIRDEQGLYWFTPQRGKI